MESKNSIQALLLWRFEKARADAPPAPKMAQLFECARPWWDKEPEQFQAFVERVSRIQVEYGHAMADLRLGPVGHRVPSLIAFHGEELEAFVQILYLNVRESRLRLRFQLETSLAPPPDMLEVNFINQNAAKPLLTVQAAVSVDHEYSIDAEVPEDLASAWKTLKVTDRMPFHFILRLAETAQSSQ